MFTISATNAAGLGTNTTLTVIESPVQVAVDPLPAVGQDLSP